MKSIGVILPHLVVFFMLFGACSKDYGTSPPPGTHRVVYQWVDDIFYVPRNEYTEFGFDALVNDTVYGEVMLLNGEEIAMCAIMDEENFERWENSQACQFIQYYHNKQYYEFYFCMPVSDRCYLVVLSGDSLSSIEARAAMHVARWEK